MKLLGTHRDFLDLASDYNLIVPQKQYDNWRLLYPNLGEIDGFDHFGLGLVAICATNGIEAYFKVDESGTLWRGHLRSFNGPIAKEYVWPEDWDYEKRKRKVKVFRRADGTFAIIPQDSFNEQYWSKHQRMSQDELNIWAEVGYGRLNIRDVDKQLELLWETRNVTKKATPKKKSRQQEILAKL